MLLGGMFVVECDCLEWMRESRSICILLAVDVAEVEIETEFGWYCLDSFSRPSALRRQEEVFVE